ncbi:MAG: DUF429 domain-containing protein [Chloroflexi bacterium]|nr:DUF429 domain-containing protein [Chloroflexota bacterium]MYF81314.1 DUF429 domain-containing protein [Chloroflexota bacterium]MYI04509.1 DUF429 domain-containing protein [Chloroflexota bacterium]
MPTFIGLDLAWSAKNESGICWLEGDSRENLRCARIEARACETETLADEVASASPAVVTIDAPLLCTKERWVDSEIGRKHRFHPFKIAARPAKAALQRGERAGVDLGTALKARGFDCEPPSLRNTEVIERSAMEVYPHTIHVRLFRLAERIPYKKNDKRTWAFCQAAMRSYQRHMATLIEREAPGILDHPVVQQSLDPAITQSLIGKAYKRLDDTLDGLTCALAAYLIWKEPERWERIGDQNGYIVVPRPLDEQPAL